MSRTTASTTTSKTTPAAQQSRRTPVQTHVSLQWRIVIPLLLLMALSGGLAYLLILGNTPDAPLRDRQLFGIGVGIASALMTAATFLLINATTRRANRVTNTLNQLRVGQHTARTGMRASDELGRVAQAVDHYADYVQEKRDEMRSAMRRTRSEAAHLNAILEALPDGVIVQDTHGRVLLMNEYARKLLGAPLRARANAMNELTALVTDQLGPMLSPNLYALGEPQQIELDGKLLRAQAAAVLGEDEIRVGTVLTLRDATDEICRERDREVLLKRLERNIQQPMMSLARDTLNAGGMTNTGDFARELTRHAFTLQKMIVELRDLGETTPEILERSQKPIQLEVLVWAVSNEWRQIAHACQITLKVTTQTRGLYVLGDDRRLRWAIGNLIDNAIKYTQPGGTVTLEIRGEQDGAAQLRIRDNGVGIVKHEQPMLFTRFWRGTPRTPEGRAIRVPGMGQGLYIARQIIEAHGGRIDVRSKPAVGTAVYFSLPTTASEGFRLPFFDSEMDGETTRLDQPDDFFPLEPQELNQVYRSVEAVDGADVRQFAPPPGATSSRQGNGHHKSHGDAGDADDPEVPTMDRRSSTSNGANGHHPTSGS